MSKKPRPAGYEGYRGKYLNGKKNGKGTYETAKYIYKGNFENDKFNGKGEMTFTNGNSYVGNFVDGYYNGYGKLITNEYIYEGNFENHEYHGQGKITPLDDEGDNYEGNFVDGKYNGYGKLIQNEFTYEGNFENDKFNGEGKITYSDGTFMEGNFVDCEYTDSNTDSNTGENTKSGNQRTLDELNEIINVFNPLIPGEQSASEFFDEQEDYNPFIIRTPNGIFSGDAIDWPAATNAGKIFVECLDNTPKRFQGNSYGQFVKPNAKRFVKMKVSGGLSFVIVPPWYRNGNPPGTKYFNLEKIGTVFKFMSEVVESQQLPADPEFFLGAEHCSQEGEVDIYELEQITLKKLNNMVTMGDARGITKKGKKGKKTKTRKGKKGKKGKKTKTRKGKKGKKTKKNKTTKKGKKNKTTKTKKGKKKRV